MNEEIEMQLWEYVDGTCSEADRQRIALLIEQDATWRQLYDEVCALQAGIAGSLHIEHPSMRFSKNVMEAVAATHIAPATTRYINKGIIRGIAAFFIIAIIAFGAYAMSMVSWTDASFTAIPTIKLPTVDISGLFTSTAFNCFMAVNVAVGLVLLDGYLRRKKAKSA